jgi:hypothetical protein
LLAFPFTSPQNISGRWSKIDKPDWLFFSGIARFSTEVQTIEFEAVTVPIERDGYLTIPNDIIDSKEAVVPNNSYWLYFFVEYFSFSIEIPPGVGASLTGRHKDGPVAKGKENKGQLNVARIIGFLILGLLLSVMALSVFVVGLICLPAFLSLLFIIFRLIFGIIGIIVNLFACQTSATQRR